MMTAPLGYHVHMCSTVNFVFGDEETVMPKLTHVSNVWSAGSTLLWNACHSRILYKQPPKMA